MTRTQRQRIIKSLIQGKRIANQQELAFLLTDQHIAVTQSTLSRDLKEVGAIKVAGPGGTHYQILEEFSAKEGLQKVIALEILGVEANEFMIIVHTLKGRASGVGEFIDGEQNPDLMGTVAGDNTLMLIPKSVKKIPALLKWIKSFSSDKEEQKNIQEP